MSLNFNNLPSERATASGALLDKGIYHAQVKKGEMRLAASGNNYLEVQLLLQGHNGEVVSVYDKFFNSDKPIPRFKIGQFLRALNTIPDGDFELADLIKIIPNKTLDVAITSEQNAGYSTRNIVDAFDKEIYYPSTTAVAQNIPSPGINDNDDLPFDMSDADTADNGSESY